MRQKNDCCSIFTGDTIVITIKPIWISATCPEVCIGNISWQKTFGMANSVDVAFSISPTTNGGAVIGADSLLGEDNTDALIARIDSSGNVQWKKTIKRVAYLDEKSIAVTVTSDGGVVVAYPIKNRSDIYTLVAKFNPTGGLTWRRSLTSDIKIVRIWDIQKTSDGGFILAGNDGEVSLSNVWIIKLNSQAQLQWKQTFNPMSGHYSRGTAVAQAVDNSIFVVGCSGGSIGRPEKDLLLIKLTAEGNINVSPGCLELAFQFKIFTGTKPVSVSTPSGFSLTESPLLALGNPTLTPKSYGLRSSSVCPSGNPNPGPSCGNDICESGENSNNCPQDCKEPEPSCHPCYSVCLDPDKDVDCGEIPYTNFRACSADPYRLDGDNDGIACED